MDRYCGNSGCVFGPQASTANLGSAPSIDDPSFPSATDPSVDGGTPELTILMPCLNEYETVALCVSKAKSFLDREALAGEVLVADNGSTDGSQDSAISAGARVISVSSRGYGSALIAGIAAAKSEFVIMGDCDDSYDFTALHLFVAELRSGADLVMGNRFKGGIAPGAMPALHRYIGNPILSGLGRLFFKSRVKDFHCGLRGFRRSSILRLDLQSSGMEFASEMVVKAQLNALAIVEVPTSLQPAGRSREPHLRSWSDGWRHLRFLLLFSPRWLFWYPGIVSVALGSSVGLRLLLGSWKVGPIQLGVNSLFAASGLTLIGYQSMWFAVLSKAFGAREGLLPGDIRVDRLRARFRLERALLGSFGTGLAGLAGGIVALSRWASVNFGALDPATSLRLLVPSMTLVVLSAQTALASLMLSILGLPSSRPRPTSLADHA